MAFSYKNILVHLVFIIFIIFVASPQFGNCRPLLVDREWSSEYGLIWQLLANGPAPGSEKDPHHP
jgi:hypothetical protein